jgi:RNA polymerase-binding transcription factor DksA
MGTEFSAAADSASPGGFPAADVRRLEEIEVELAAVEATLRRLDEGRYGTCEVCGAALEADALEADPLTARCSGHPG